MQSGPDQIRTREATRNQGVLSDRLADDLISVALFVVRRFVSPIVLSSSCKYHVTRYSAVKILSKTFKYFRFLTY